MRRTSASCTSANHTGAHHAAQPIIDVEDLRTVWKDARYKIRRRSRPGGPRIRISGTMGYGRLKIRHARR